MQYLHPYPKTWPGPDPTRPKKLVSKVDPGDLIDLYNRRVTTKAFAAKYGVSPKWVSKVYPGRRETANKAERRLARNALREFHAEQAVRGSIGIAEAAKRACCSYSAMRRIVLRVSGLATLGELNLHLRAKK